MKLRTSLTASRDGSIVDATDENLIHDAAAAHAYKKAVALELSMPQMMAVNAKSDAIMAQWGFDSGENSN